MANVIEVVLQNTVLGLEKMVAEVGALDAVKASATGAGEAIAAELAGAAGIAAIAATAAGAAFVMLGARLADSIVYWDNLSAATGISINNIRTLERVMIEAGKSPDALSTGLVMMKRNLDAGRPSLVAMVGATKDPMTALLRLAQLAEKTGDAALVAFRAMGIGGMQLAPVLATLAERMADVHARFGELSESTIEGGK